MKRYRIYHPLILSFFSRRLYRDVCYNWRGAGLLTLALLSLVMSASKSYELYSIILGAAPEIRHVIKKEHVSIKVKDGVASVSPDRPITIDNPYSDGPFVVVDTEGITDRLDEIDQGIYLSKDTLYVKFRRDKVEEYPLSGFKDTVVNADDIGRFLDFYVTYFFPIALLFGFGGFFFVNLVTAFGLGAIGLVFARIWKADPSFMTMLRLGCISLTPASMIESGLSVTHSFVQFQDLGAIIVSLVYMNLAVKWCYGRPAVEKSA